MDPNGEINLEVAPVPMQIPEPVSYGMHQPQPKDSSCAAYVIIGLVLAALIGGGLLWWAPWSTKKPVTTGGPGLAGDAYVTRNQKVLSNPPRQPEPSLAGTTPGQPKPNTDCMSCKECVGCSDAMNCTKCTNCEELMNCQGCINCVDIQNCTNCANSSDCQNCKDCMGCKDCQNCKNCQASSDCQNCSGCKGCSDCQNCIDCTECQDCQQCTDCQDCTWVGKWTRVCTGKCGLTNTYAIGGKFACVQCKAPTREPLKKDFTGLRGKKLPKPSKSIQAHANEIQFKWSVKITLS